MNANAFYAMIKQDLNRNVWKNRTKKRNEKITNCWNIFVTWYEFTKCNINNSLCILYLIFFLHKFYKPYTFKYFSAKELKYKNVVIKKLLLWE